MFNSKQTKLFDVDSNKTTSAKKTNSFISGSLRKGAEILSGNGALKYSTTGNPFIDQFGKLGSYKVQRPFNEIASDMSVLWAKNPYLTVCFVLFIRTITRIVSLFDGIKTTSVQRGAGLKHEGIIRMLWLSVNHPDVFWKNVSLFISVGSWKDIIYMLSYDIQYNGWNNRMLDWNNLGQLLLAGLENPRTSELVKKYLPQIKANSKCTTLEAQADNIIAKWLCNLLFPGYPKQDANYKMYRVLKASGTAHQWQQLISKGKHKLVDFDTIHGRALSQLVSSKYITKQGLTDKYTAWIQSKPVAKFTGYVHELFKVLPKYPYQVHTLNAQFMGLVETAKKGALAETSMIVVRDTSGSMSSLASGTTQRCGDIAKALALFFSYMLPKGAFANAWIEFNSAAKLHVWEGTTPYEKWNNDRSNYIGSTNFQSVINLFCDMLRKGIPESEFPSGIICISDGEFNPIKQLDTTNVQYALNSLRTAGFSEEYINNFKIVLWNLQNSYYGKGTGEKFETYGNTPNVYYFSGYDASIMAFLTGTEHVTKVPKNAEELFAAAMDQEIMKMIQI